MSMTIEERIMRVETELPHVKALADEIKGAIQRMPDTMQRSMELQLRRQRARLKRDTAVALEKCRQSRTTPPTSALKPDMPWDLSWLKQVAVGLAILGSLIGGAVAAISSGTPRPAIIQPADPRP
jgi:hypothetical protein